jgi:hypothetical protein
MCDPRAGLAFRGFPKVKIPIFVYPWSPFGGVARVGTGACRPGIHWQKICVLAESQNQCGEFNGPNDPEIGEPWTFEKVHNLDDAGEFMPGITVREEGL